jgi:hypothetical protein
VNTPRALQTQRDRWLERLVAAAGPNDASSTDGNGRVLRLKLGFNPNSSSVGSVVTTLLWSASVSVVALNVATALIQRARGEVTLHGPAGREPEGATETSSGEDE